MTYTLGDYEKWPFEEVVHVGDWLCLRGKPDKTGKSIYASFGHSEDSRQKLLEHYANAQKDVQESAEKS